MTDQRSRWAATTARLVLIVALLVVAAVTTLIGVQGRAQAAAAAPTLAVSGNRLVDAATGAPLRLAGVNRSGSEYACVQGWGMFDGPVDDTALSAIAAWGTNVVRVPLNEDCWLGINNAPAAYSGANYRAAIAQLVTRLHAHGQAVILDLHWAAPGQTESTGQLMAPDASHATAFWTSVATAFGSDPSVAFEVFNEPHDISWDCWLNGCTTSAGWLATGMQQLVTAIRATGATQPIILDGLNWGGDLSGWAAHVPTDPDHALVAGWHVYNFSGCNNASCWNTYAAPLALTYPVLLTEVGENDCASGFLDQILPWADAHDIGYLAWAWNTASCGSGPSLISDYSGTPTTYGAGFRAHLASLAAAGPEPSTAAPVVSESASAAPGSPSLPGTPTAASTATARPGRHVIFDFESGTTESWHRLWGAIAVANETGAAATGSHGLALRVRRGGHPAVGARTGRRHLGAGTILTLKVRAPRGVVASVSPLLVSSSRTLVLRRRRLKVGWNAIRFRLPTTGRRRIRRIRRIGRIGLIGLRIDDPHGWTGTLDLDDVTAYR